MIERLRSRIEQIVNGLLDRVAAAGQADLIQDFAYPLPSSVISEMLGVLQEDRDAFKIWSDAPVVFLGNVQANPEIDRQTVRGHDVHSCYVFV